MDVQSQSKFLISKKHLSFVSIWLSSKKDDLQPDDWKYSFNLPLLDAVKK